MKPAASKQFLVMPEAPSLKPGLPQWMVMAAFALSRLQQSAQALCLHFPKQWGGAQCTHTRLPLSEGKLVCPDCGDGFVGRWVRLRCSQCQRIVASRYALGKAFQTVLSLNACCHHCGHRGAQTEWIESPDVFQMQEALLVLEALQSEEKAVGKGMD